MSVSFALERHGTNRKHGRASSDQIFESPDDVLKPLPRFYKIQACKVGCIFVIVISSELRMGQYGDDDYREDAPHFRINESYRVEIKHSFSQTHLPQCLQWCFRNLIPNFSSVIWHFSVSAHGGSTWIWSKIRNLSRWVGTSRLKIFRPYFGFRIFGTRIIHNLLTFALLTFK